MPELLQEFEVFQLVFSRPDLARNKREKETHRDEGPPEPLPHKVLAYLLQLCNGFTLTLTVTSKFVVKISVQQLLSQLTMAGAFLCASGSVCDLAREKERAKSKNVENLGSGRSKRRRNTE